jgi:hypothetical protein
LTCSVHITKIPSTTAPSNCPAQADGNKYTACDVTILGVTNLTANTTTIQDDLISQGIPDANLAMYIVGEPVQAVSSSAIGYSRFTTSPSVPTWLVGTGGPSGSCKVGSLYSRTSGGSGANNTIYACATGTGWTGIK